MKEYYFTDYSVNDESSILALEKLCTQGDSIVLRYKRDNFRARSEVYENYRIICVKIDNKVIGVGAWSSKNILLRGKEIHTAFIYDTRVHPDYRKKGVAWHLIHYMLKNIDTNPECIYMFVAADNTRCLKPVQKLIGFKLAIPFTILVIPVYKKIKHNIKWSFSEVNIIHDMYLKYNSGVDFLPHFKKKLLKGYISSISIDNERTGCSIWTNKNLLAEEIVRIPLHYQIERIITDFLRPVIKLPHIPKPKEKIRSWFLFDVYAYSKTDLKRLITVAKNHAFTNNQHFLYIRLQNNDPLLKIITENEFRYYKIPYYFLARGTQLPGINDRIYIDVRDL